MLKLFGLGFAYHEYSGNSCSHIILLTWGVSISTPECNKVVCVTYNLIAFWCQFSNTHSIASVAIPLILNMVQQLLRRLFSNGEKLPV